MERIVSTIVEDVPKGLKLVALYGDKERKDDEGNVIQCAEVLTPYKKVILFDEEGRMGVKYYTEEEWNDTEARYGKSRTVGRMYHPMYIDHLLFLSYLNANLEYCTLKEVVNDIVDGFSSISLDDLSVKSKQLIEAVRIWDCSTPFKFNDTFCQTEGTDDDGEKCYEVECFKFIKFK